MTLRINNTDLLTTLPLVKLAKAGSSYNNIPIKQQVKQLNNSWPPPISL